MLLALVGPRTSSCCLCQASSASSSRLGLAAHHRRHQHRLSSSSSDPRTSSCTSRYADDLLRLRRQRRVGASPAATLTTSTGRWLPRQRGKYGGNRSGGEGAKKKIALLSGSVAAAAATSWFVDEEPPWTGRNAADDDALDSSRLDATALLFPSSVSSFVGQQRRTDATSRCEGHQAGPPHFSSAASLFQHHMSKEKETDDANDYHHDEEDHEEDDNHPQSKEPECFLCRVHRQGPCGTLWKDLEMCVQKEEKNNQVQSNSTDPCKVCASQFETCWKKHAGLYSLIALEEQSMDLHKLRKQHDVIMSDTPLSNSTVAVEWDAWNQFLSNSPTASHDIVKNYRRRVSQNGNIRFRGPLWKRFDKYQMTNPFLIRVSARIPRTIGGSKSEQVLYAVALDQQNRVLGFVEVGGGATTRKETQEDDDDNNLLNMKIVIVPGLTESVKIQLWTTSSAAHGGAISSASGKAPMVLRETVPQSVDYGASTNSMLALQNQRTRTQKVKSATAS